MVVYMGDLLFPCILDENRPIIFSEMEDRPLDYELIQGLVVTFMSTI